jgi:hypothetical protein
MSVRCVRRTKLLLYFPDTLPQTRTGSSVPRALLLRFLLVLLARKRDEPGLGVRRQLFSLGRGVFGARLGSDLAFNRFIYNFAYCGIKALFVEYWSILYFSTSIHTRLNMPDRVPVQ